jgi:hypothetical protein
MLKPRSSGAFSPCSGTNAWPAIGDDEAKIKGDLDTRTRAGLLKGGEGQLPTLVPGQPERSPLYLAALRTHDDWEAMPPKEADKLYDQQLGWLKEWIASGAPWVDDAKAKAKAIAEANAAKWNAEDGIVFKTAGGQSEAWTNRRYKPESLWAYQPVKPSLPGRTVDQLIDQRFPPGVKAAPPTDARTPIRRATFDLTGLPPPQPRRPLPGSPR